MIPLRQQRAWLQAQCAPARHHHRAAPHTHDVRFAQRTCTLNTHVAVPTSASVIDSPSRVCKFLISAWPMVPLLSVSNRANTERRCSSCGMAVRHVAPARHKTPQWCGVLGVLSPVWGTARRVHQCSTPTSVGPVLVRWAHPIRPCRRAALHGAVADEAAPSPPPRRVGGGVSSAQRTLRTSVVRATASTPKHPNPPLALAHAGPSTFQACLAHDQAEVYSRQARGRLHLRHLLSRGTCRACHGCSTRQLAPMHCECPARIRQQQ